MASPTRYPTSIPQETAEWLDSFDAVVETEGPTPRPVPFDEAARAGESEPGRLPCDGLQPVRQLDPGSRQSPGSPATRTSSARIRRYIRWNAAVMVTRANMRDSGIGGHLSTYASSASFYEVGFNHFFRGKDNGTAGRPGLLPRSRFSRHLRPRLCRGTARGRRTWTTSVSRSAARACPATRTPASCPTWWEFPTVSMGLGPLSAIYQARFNRYLLNRQLADTSGSRVWCFVGDGEFDEPETRAALSLAARERLDNLTFVVNCNLQRLDGPVRGNGKIIQELEALLRGCGWNVIKVIWGRRWDELLARDVDGVLAQQDEHDPRRRLPDARHRVRRLHPRALLRPGPTPAQARGAPLRRGAADLAPRRARLPQALRRLQGGDRAGRGARRRSSRRPSRAGRSGPRSRRATPPTRSRR